MTTITNNFEEGSGILGTQVNNGNSGGTGNQPVDFVVNGTGASTVYDSTHAAHGTVSAKGVTGSPTGAGCIGWNATSIPSATQKWFRIYAYLTANPAATFSLMEMLSATTQAAALQITTSGFLQYVDSAAATILTGAVAIPLNAWWRVEGFVIASATVGQVEYKLYKTPDSTSPDETKTSAATQNTNTALVQHRMGPYAQNTLNGPAMWIDDIGVSNTGYIGPAASPAANAALLPALFP
jgi:hypothetical protein